MNAPTTTIRPEHMDQWAELTRTGQMGLYRYDHEAGYVQVRKAPERDWTPRPARTPKPAEKHGKVSHYLMGCQHVDCLAEGERYHANGGTAQPWSIE